APVRVMKSLCSTLNMDLVSLLRSNFIRTPGRTGSAPSQTKRPAQGRPHFKQLQENWRLVARGPADVHATAPRRLPQAHQAACRRLSFRAARRRAGAIFEIGDTRHKRLLAEKPSE